MIYVVEPYGGKEVFSLHVCAICKSLYNCHALVCTPTPQRPYQHICSQVRHMKHVQVALFEPTPMACELLSHAIESSCDEIKVITTGVSSEFQNHAELQKADVAVISLALKDDPFGGLKLLRRLRRERPNLNCALLLDEDNREVVIEAFRSGAVAVCGRDKPCRDLCKCIRCVSEGQVWASSRQTRYMLEALAQGLPPLVTDAKGTILLSSREQEIASKVAEGMRNREIAELLRVSEHTVKNHLFRIFERLGISSRAELILYLHSRHFATKALAWLLMIMPLYAD
jgi:DNA-binding NarL/FixJ family response regulator